MCVGSRAVAGVSLQEWLSVRHLGLDHDQTGRAPQLITRPNGQDGGRCCRGAAQLALALPSETSPVETSSALPA